MFFSGLALLGRAGKQPESFPPACALLTNNIIIAGSCSCMVYTKNIVSNSLFLFLFLFYGMGGMEVLCPSSTSIKVRSSLPTTCSTHTHPTPHHHHLPTFLLWFFQLIMEILDTSVSFSCFFKIGLDYCSSSVILSLCLSSFMFSACMLLFISWSGSRIYIFTQALAGNLDLLC